MRIASMPTAWNTGAWPFRPRPQADELLSSYLTRIAHGLGLKPITLMNAAWGSRQSLLAQDLDNFANALVVKRVSGATGLDPDEVRAMTLAATEGRIATTYYPKGRKIWIMPVTIFANDRRRPGLQFCPFCLRTDERPYLRRIWRLAFTTCCTRHSVQLLDCCPKYGQHLHAHRAQSIHECFYCGFDLATAAVTPADPLLANQQRIYEDALRNGWTSLCSKPLYSHLYFMIVRQIASLFANGPRSWALRQAAVEMLGGRDGEFEKHTWRQPIEYLGVAERARLMELVARSISDFPDAFVAICRKAHLARSHVIKDMPYLPFVYVEAAREHLDRTPYQPTDGEVAAAAAWLRRTHGIATYRALKDMFGESRDVLYRHMDYERVPSAPSWRRSRAMNELKRTKRRIDPVAD